MKKFIKFVYKNDKWIQLSILIAIAMFLIGLYTGGRWEYNYFSRGIAIGFWCEHCEGHCTKVWDKYGNRIYKITREPLIY